MMMKKKKSRKKTVRTTIASVKMEMQKPRLTASVRTAGEDQAAPVLDKCSARSARV
jgi:hypothetical protein